MTQQLNRRTRWIGLAAIGVVALFTAALGRGEPSATRTVSGESVKLGNGTARAYVTTENGRPVEIGISLSEKAMEGLKGPVPGAHPEHLMERYLLPAPEGLPAPYKLIELGWNPMGHEPPGIYDRPHFDFHFYTITREERDAMVPSDPLFQEKGTRHPTAEFIPERYFAPAPLVIPQMGLHWLDRTTPEINGKPFTTTFLYGSYDGKVIFAEPMITKATIEAKQDFEVPVPTAAKVQVPGYYPTSYRVRWDAETREYRIALTKLVSR
jgi:hypothetical protein